MPSNAAPVSAQPPMQATSGNIPPAPTGAPPPLNPELQRALQASMGGQQQPAQPPQPAPTQVHPTHQNPQPVSAQAHPAPTPQDPGSALAALLGQAQPEPVTPSPNALPDLPGDNTPFNFLDLGQLQEPAPKPKPESDDAVAELTKLVQELAKKSEGAENDAKFQQALAAKTEEIKRKYGAVDQNVLNEFSDLISTVRAAIGSEMETQFTAETLRLQQTVDALKAQIESMGQAPAAQSQKQDTPQAQEPTAQSFEVYRNTLAEVIPDYGRIAASPQFKQLMAMPVDPYNPDYTYNAKLGRMFKDRKTSDIVQFFADFGKKYLNGGQQATTVPVSTFAPAPNPVTPSLTPDKVSALFSSVLKGELHATPSEISALQNAVARLTT